MIRYDFTICNKICVNICTTCQNNSFINTALIASRIFGLRGDRPIYHNYTTAQDPGVYLNSFEIEKRVPQTSVWSSFLCKRLQYLRLTRQFRTQTHLVHAKALDRIIISIWISGIRAIIFKQFLF